MRFNEHRDLAGKHAFMSPSKVSWMRYDEARFAEVYKNSKAVERGVILHSFAETCIRLGQKLPRSKATLNRYVNDAIGFGMSPERVLYYSPLCFGTADAISFEDTHLRIHDLKTGVTPAHMEQLVGYAALFCLEYGIDPGDISIDLRIYQSEECVEYSPSPEEVREVMNKIVVFDELARSIEREESE